MGMGILTAGCLALGLGASWFLPVFDSITQQAMGVRISSALIAANGFALSAGTARAGTVSTAGIAAMLVLLGALPVLYVFVWGRGSRRCTGPVWDCGLPGLTAANEYTATGFSKPLRMIFSAFYRPQRDIQADFETSPYYPTSIRFESEVEATFEKRIYGPLKDTIMALARRMRAVQAGSIHTYLAYIFVTLVLLLLFGVRG
jgi:hydrogenase-4 component B